MQTKIRNITLFDLQDQDIQITSSPIKTWGGGSQICGYVEIEEEDWWDEWDGYYGSDWDICEFTGYAIPFRTDSERRNDYIDEILGTSPKENHKNMIKNYWTDGKVKK